MMARARGYLALIVLVGGGMVLVGMLMRGCSLTATKSTGQSALWVRTPHVAPGDRIAMEVEVQGGKKIAIETLVVHDGDSALVIHGRGADWGAAFTTSNRARGEDKAEFFVEVPADAPAGSTMHLRVEVHYVVAQRTGTGSFDNHLGHDVMKVDVPVLTPAMRTLRKTGSALVALLLLGGLCVAVLLARRPLDRWLGSNDGTGKVVAVVLLVSAPVYAVLGYPLFAMPLVAATGILATWFAIAAMVVWGTAPVLLRAWSYQRHKHDAAIGLRAVAIGARGEDPYRTAATPLERVPDREPEPRALDEVVAVLQRAGLTVRRRRRGSDLRGAARTDVMWVRVADRARVMPSGLTIVTSKHELAFDLALALVPVFGPVEISMGRFGAFVVDESTTRAGLGDELTRQLARRLENQ